jgi:hypothetical protein
MRAWQKKALLVSLCALFPFGAHWLSGEPLERGPTLAITYILAVMFAASGSTVDFTDD